MPILGALRKIVDSTIGSIPQIERRRSNFRPGFFDAVAFKFEPNLTIEIKYLPQKVDFCQVPL